MPGNCSYLHNNRMMNACRTSGFSVDLINLMSLAIKMSSEDVTTYNYRNEGLCKTEDEKDSVIE